MPKDEGAIVDGDDRRPLGELRCDKGSADLLVHLHCRRDVVDQHRCAVGVTDALAESNRPLGRAGVVFEPVSENELRCQIVRRSG